MDTQPTLAPTQRALRPAESRRTVWAIVGVVSASLLLQLAGVAFAYLNRAVPLREGLSPWPDNALYVLPWLSGLVVGALVALRRPAHPLGWLWLLSSFAGGLQAIAQGYATYALLAAPGTLPLGTAALALVPAAWVSNIAVWPFLLLLFPTGRLPSPRWRMAAWAVVVSSVIMAALGWAAPGPSGFIPMENPLGDRGPLGVAADIARSVGAPIVFAALVASAVSLVLRFRRASGTERQQLKWFALGGAALGAYICSMPFINDSVNIVFGTLAPTALPIATGIAILRHRLFDIDVIIRRTVIYGALTAALAGVYALVVGAAGVLLPTQSSLLPLLVTIAVAVPLARPCYRLLQRLPLPQSEPVDPAQEFPLRTHKPVVDGAVAVRTVGAPGPDEAGMANAALDNSQRAVKVPAVGRQAGALRLARATALIIAAVAIAQFLVSIPFRFAELSEPCLASAVRCEELARPTTAEAELLASLSLSLEADALATMALIVASAAVWLGAAALIFVYRRDDSMALLTALMLALLGPGLFGGAEALAQTSPAWWLVAKLVGLCTFAAAILFFYLFPGGQFAPRWSRWFALAWLVSNAATLLVDEQPAWLSTVSFFGFFVPALASIAFLVYRYRRIADQTQRQQVKWVVFGLTGTLGAILTLLVLTALVFGSLTDPRSYLLLSFQPILFLGIPLSIGVATLRHRLFDIDVIIRRTVIYGALTVMLAGLYALAVGAAGVLLPTQGALLPLLVTLAVAVPLARPLHRLLQRLPLPEGQLAPEEDPALRADAHAQEHQAHSETTRRKDLLYRVVPGLGGMTGAATVAMTIGYLVFATLNGRPAFEAVVEQNLFFPIAFGLIGSLVALRQPLHPIGWIYCLGALLWWSGVLSHEYAVYTLETSPGALPAGTWAAWLAHWVSDPGWAMLVFSTLILPTGRLPSRKWRPLGWTATGLVIVHTAAQPFAPGPLTSVPSITNPLANELAGAVLAIESQLGFLLIATALAGLASLLVRYRTSAGLERQQLKWIAYVAVVSGFVFTLQNLSGLLLLTPEIVALGNIWHALLPVAVGIAILRHRLFDIDVIIRRTVVYGTLTAALAGVYAIAVGAAGALLPGQSPLLPALITLAMAAPLARPLHRLLQRLPLPQGQRTPEEAPPMIADIEVHVADARARRAALLARVVPPLGVLAGAASVAMGVGSAIFSALNGNPLAQAIIEAGVWAAVAFGILGALVTLRRPLHSLGWIYCLVALSQGLVTFAYQYATYALITRPDSLPFGPLMSWLGSIAWFPGLALALTFALLLFPNGRLPSLRWRHLAWSCGVLQALWAPFTLDSWPYRGRLLLENPEQIQPTAVVLLLGLICFLGTLLCSFLSVASLVVRYRSASSMERQQIKWLALGGAATLAAVVIGNFVPLFSENATSRLLLTPLTTTIPVAAGIAILRHRLFDIDLIIRRTVVYAVLVGALVALYFGSVALIQALARALTGPQSDLAIVALTLLIAALFNPLRVRVQGFIDRRFYREKVDFRVAFTAFAREVRTVIELPALLALLVERTTTLLHIAHGAVFLRDERGAFALAEGRALPPAADALPADADDLARLAGGEPLSRPRDPAFPLLLPLLAPRPTAGHAVATDLVGVLALGPRLSDQRFSRDDEALLLGLADQAGTAIYVAQLIALQRAEAARREEQERQLAARRASPIGRAEAVAETLLADLPAAFVALHRLANEAGQSAEATRLLEHLPGAIGLLDHPAAPRLTGLADGLGYLVASRAEPELLPAGLRALAANFQPGADEPLDYAAEALAWYELCGRALEASSVAAIAELLPALPTPGAVHTGPLADLVAALGELHEAAGALRANERVDTPQDRLAYLAAAVERLSRVDRTAAELGAADQPIVQRIAERWLAVAAGVMGELQTRARLACRLLTRHTWHDDLVALTLTLRNDGRGAALNLQVSLTAGNEYTPLDAPARVERLLTGEEVSLTLRVRPHIAPGAGYFQARFLVRYDDPRGPDQVEQFADEVQLLAEEGAFQFIPNPYVVGTPLQNGSPLFFGRQDVLGFVEENLQAAHRNNLVLIGQRRTGKTSLLKQLPDRLGQGYLPVYLDGQSLGLDPGMPAFFLALATEIAFALDDRGISVEPPEPEEFAASPAAAFERGFLPRVRAALGGRHLLLLLDEFEELEAAVRRGSLDASLFGFLRHLVQHTADLSVIFCGTHRLEELASDYWNVLFNISLYRHVGFLSRSEAERLVQEPVAPYGMRYDDLALEKIWRVTSGHPYFLQLLCHSLVNRHNKSGRSYLTVADLNDALDEILAAGEAHFVYLWAESSEHERLVLAALSRAVALTGRATPAQVADYLADRGMGLERATVADALHRLALRDILAAADGDAGAGDAYGWKLGLLGLWVEKYRSLSRVIDEVRV